MTARLSAATTTRSCAVPFISAPVRNLPEVEARHAAVGGEAPMVLFGKEPRDHAAPAGCAKAAHDAEVPEAESVGPQNGKSLLTHAIENRELQIAIRLLVASRIWIYIYI